MHIVKYKFDSNYIFNNKSDVECVGCCNEFCEFYF